jgi:hypothetical protein
MRFVDPALADSNAKAENADAVARVERARARMEIAERQARREIATRVLLVLVESHDNDRAFNRTLAGRAVAYADDLIKTLVERKP